MRKINAADKERIIIDDGKIFSNAIFDLNHDSIEILVRGGTLRNCGFIGTEGINIEVNVPAESEATLNHLYMGEGDGFLEGYNQGFDAESPVFVSSSHEGIVYMNELNVQGFSAHGIEASPPGRPTAHSGGGQKGVVSISNSFVSNCDYSPIDVGSDRSKLSNCVVRDSVSREGFHVKYGRVELENCTVDVPGNFVKVASDEYGRQRGATAALTGCFKSPEMGSFDLRTGGVCSGFLNESDAPAHEPQGVPLNAQEAVERESSAKGPVFP